METIHAKLAKALNIDVNKLYYSDDEKTLFHDRKRNVIHISLDKGNKEYRISRGAAGISIKRCDYKGGYLLQDCNDVDKVVETIIA